MRAKAPNRGDEDSGLNQCIISGPDRYQSRRSNGLWIRRGADCTLIRRERGRWDVDPHIQRDFRRARGDFVNAKMCQEVFSPLSSVDSPRLTMLIVQVRSDHHQLKHIIPWLKTCPFLLRPSLLAKPPQHEHHLVVRRRHVLPWGLKPARQPLSGADPLKALLENQFNEIFKRALLETPKEISLCLTTDQK